MNLNRATIIGRLTRDPELKSLPSGVAVASFSLATNNVYKDKDGKKQETTEFINVIVFGQSAQNAGQYLKKGQEAYVEGRIQTRSWDAQDGTKRYRTEVVAEKVQFGSKANSEGSSEATQPRSGYDRGSNKTQKSYVGPGIEYPEEDINPDDIPF